MAIDTSVIVSAVITVAGSGGAAWAGVRASLNGTRERVTRIENKLDKALDTQAKHGERIASVEARIE